MFFKTWLEWFFPPLCVCCKERCETLFFCPACWWDCAPVDPDERCPHCFEESEKLCEQCKIDEVLTFPRASVFGKGSPPLLLARERPDTIACFAIYQWVLLDWEIPDVVIPMQGAKEIARRFAEMIDRPYAPILRGERCDGEAIEEDQIVLLIDQGREIEKAKKAIDAISETFPKRGYLLSLFPY